MHDTCAGVTKDSVGFRIATVDVRSATPSLTSGSLLNFRSAWKVVVRRALNAGDCSSAGVPTRTAVARSGDAAANALNPGWNAVNSSAVLARKGWITGKSRMPTRSVGGPSVIVSWM